MTDPSLLQDFITETGEHLEATERNLMRLQQKPDDLDVLNDIFRSIHTIKGSSEYLGIERVAELSHKLENLLDRVRRGEIGVDAGVIELLIGTNDRFGALMDELSQHQAEKSPIDDLLAGIDGYVKQAGEAQATVDTDDIEGDNYDDEYDEELFNIFVEQLKEGLQGLADEADQLQSGADGQAVLERCADRLSTLRSSANYMGYDELKGTYAQWLKAVEAVQEKVIKGQQVDLGAFAIQIGANIDQVKALFPKVFASVQETAPAVASAPPAEPEPIPEPEAVSMSTPTADTSLLEDFIAETGEHLEETEQNLMRLEQKPDDLDVLNDIFRSIHTIKGSSEYLGMERIAELSHKLENLLDMLRRGEIGIDADVIELLIEASDRIGRLIEDIEHERTEQAPVGDLIDRIDTCVETKSAAPVGETSAEAPQTYTDVQGNTYEEVYDQELFAIYIEQLNAGLKELTHASEQLEAGDGVEEVLTRCADRLATLRSSANYMEYYDLKIVLDNWLAKVEDSRSQLTEGKKIDFASLNQEVMLPNIDRVKGFFLGIPAVAEAPSAKMDVETKAEPAAPKAQAESPAAEPPSVKPAEPPKDPKPLSSTEQPDFEVVTLADLEEDPVIDVVGSLSDASDGSDDALLQRLESAFEANMGEMSNKENGSLSKDIESTLLSGEQPVPQFSAATVESHDIMDDYVQNENRAGDQSGMIFSGGETDEKLDPAKPPSTFKAADSTALDPAEASEQRGGRYKIGRRQTDKFRDRMLKQSIRVDAAKIDVLMNQVGELVVSRSGFMQLINDMRELQFFLKQTQKLDQKEMHWVKEITNRISDATASFGRVTSDLQENVMKVRMLPIAQLFSRYPRLVHDLVKGTQKKVSLEIHGEETELDKMVIEQIADPLVHIIRNAVDHGIEDVAERQQKGKAEEGTLRLEAFHESNYVVIEISDDGRGIDANQIKNSAIKGGFANLEEVESMGEQELLTLIMRPGFSTAKAVTHTSGRGVGMDVVKDNIEKLNGTIDIVSTIGAGVTFRIKIPLTLAIIPALLVRVASELFTIPLPSVDETLRVSRDEISTIEGLEVFYVRDNAIPLIRLSRVFKMASSNDDQDEHFVVVVNTGAKQVGLVVDELRSRQEVVIKPLEDYLQEKSGFSGATILGDGSISLIIDVSELIQLALGRYAEQAKLAPV